MVLIVLLILSAGPAAPPGQLAYDVVVYKDLEGVAHAAAASVSTAQRLGRKLGETIEAQGTGDRAVIQKAIDSLPGGGRILIKRGVYNLGSKGLRIPYPSHFRIEGEGFDPHPEVLQEYYKDSWSYGGTCLVYRGEGDALYFGARTESGIDPRASFEISNIALRLKRPAQSALHLKEVNHAILEQVGVATDKPSAAGILIEGEGGGTKFLKLILVRGPFEVGIDLRTHHVLLVKAEVEGYRGYAFKLGKDCKVVAAVVRTESEGALGGVLTYPARCPQGDERCRVSYPVTLVNVFDQSQTVKQGYVPFVADGAALVLVGCGKSPKLEARLYDARNGGKVDDTAQVLKEPSR